MAPCCSQGVRPVAVLAWTFPGMPRRMPVNRRRRVWTHRLKGGVHTSHRKPEKKKRRTREHVIADLSINHVERQALLAGFAVQRIVRDYGIDLFLATYDHSGSVENGEIRVQLKATDAPGWSAAVSPSPSGLTRATSDTG